jgi:ABC-type multidrug transport system fused ATPase/permease subunit
VAQILDLAKRAPVAGQPPPARTLGALTLREVSLDYGRGPVLDRLNLTIHPGERVALLGENGAGKSTILSLICGLYPPTSGEVLLDDTPLSTAPEWWRHQQVAIVLQDTFLFSGSLADNIRYGRPEASNAEVARVAAAALVTEFADDLPDGLDTQLSDSGVGLSGGQRQRIGIARALLSNAPIVLLDEPTAGLDVRAEEVVVQALTQLMDHRTVVMTTHQPALTRLATRIVELHRGAILDAPSTPYPKASRYLPGQPRTLPDGPYAEAWPLDVAAGRSGPPGAG